MPKSYKDPIEIEARLAYEYRQLLLEASLDGASARGYRMNHQDNANKGVWSDPAAFRWLDTIQGFTDAGEERAYSLIASEMRDQPILDLGVGAGRTIPMLRNISSNYVALDYLPLMISAARRKFPDTNLQIGDARDLSRFADSSFALVAFSHAGIDAVDHEGRMEIFSEVARVLKPCGVFWFSTLNRDGPELKLRPWRIKWPNRCNHIQQSLLDLLHTVKRAIDGTWNYLRMQNLRRAGDGWMIAPFSAHDFGLLVHYTTLEHLRAELTAAGFYAQIEAVAPDGSILQSGDDLGEIDFFNVLARKRST